MTSVPALGNAQTYFFEGSAGVEESDLIFNLAPGARLNSLAR
jgi:hypothetical protein